MMCLLAYVELKMTGKSILEIGRMCLSPLSSHCSCEILTMLYLLFVFVLALLNKDTLCMNSDMEKRDPKHDL